MCDWTVCLALGIETRQELAFVVLALGAVLCTMGLLLGYAQRMRDWSL